jgi:hypothetical protein
VSKTSVFPQLKHNYKKLSLLSCFQILTWYFFPIRSPLHDVSDVMLAVNLVFEICGFLYSFSLESSLTYKTHLLRIDSLHLLRLVGAQFQCKSHGTARRSVGRTYTIF